MTPPRLNADIRHKKEEGKKKGNFCIVTFGGLGAKGGRTRRSERGMAAARFDSEIFPYINRPSSGRQFVVRAQRGAGGEPPSSSSPSSFPLLWSSFLFLIPFFATVTADPFTHTSYVTGRTDALRVVTAPLINW